MAKKRQQVDNSLMVVVIVALVAVVVLIMNSGGESGSVVGQKSGIQKQNIMIKEESFRKLWDNSLLFCGHKNQPPCPLPGSSSRGTVSIEFGEVDESSNTISVLFSSTDSISGFQFTLSSSNEQLDWVDGFEGLTGGVAGDAGFTVGIGGNDVVLGFCTTSNTCEIPAGSVGILTNIAYAGSGISTICFSDAIFTTGYFPVELIDVIYGDQCVTVNFRPISAQIPDI